MGSRGWARGDIVGVYRGFWIFVLGDRVLVSVLSFWGRG